MRLASALISNKSFLRILCSDPIAIPRTFASLSNNFNNGCGRSFTKADTAASLRICSFVCSRPSLTPVVPPPPFSFVAPASESGPGWEVLSSALPTSLPRFRFSPAAFAFASAAPSPVSSVQWLRTMSCKYRPLMNAVLNRRYRRALAEIFPESLETLFLGRASGRGTGTTMP